MKRTLVVAGCLTVLIIGLAVGAAGIILRDEWENTEW